MDSKIGDPIVTEPGLTMVPDDGWVEYASLQAWKNPFAVFVSFSGALLLSACLMAIVVVDAGTRPLVIAYTVGISPFISYMLWMGAWSYFGREEIGVLGTNLVVNRRIFGARFRTEQYASERIIMFRVRECARLLSRPASLFFMGQQLKFGVGPITFEYDGRDIRLAEALRNDSVAAEELAARLKADLGLGV
jgi:hypothetical protein